MSGWGSQKIIANSTEIYFRRSLEQHCKQHCGILVKSWSQFFILNMICIVSIIMWSEFPIIILFSVPICGPLQNYNKCWSAIFVTITLEAVCLIILNPNRWSMLLHSFRLSWARRTIETSYIHQGVKSSNVINFSWRNLRYEGRSQRQTERLLKFWIICL